MTKRDYFLFVLWVILWNIPLLGDSWVGTIIMFSAATVVVITLGITLDSLWPERRK